MEYAAEAVDYIREKAPHKYAALKEKIDFDTAKELAKWKVIRELMYLLQDKRLGVFLQQEGFLDKELIPVKELPEADRPLNQKWSWDRILRSCYIKQADVLQGIYFFEDQFDIATIKKNFDFYEPLTVHESSLSPCVHVILAAKIGNKDKAYEMYLRTARLDLDDYNNDTEDGLHITSMAGTWMAMVKGIGGMRVYNNQLYFDPFLPDTWESISFKIQFRGKTISVTVTPKETRLENFSNEKLSVNLYGKVQEIEAGSVVTV